ncbi:late histone H2B.L4-like [Perognathus longimembris pacificus]|uniref:late histone H2B.L4-like n=1 Tax=Perognathus longimembris pacificus TaxID=214514 RepID=UPI002018B2E9|nr:late histone H2B.L4-like [Perognathus longimembris pacificus]
MPYREMGNFWTFQNTDMTAQQKKTKCCRCGRRRCHRRHCHHHRCPESFAQYFPLLLNKIHPGLKLSQETMHIMDSFVKDMFARIATEASSLAHSTNRSTISARDIQAAVRLLLPENLSKNAVNQATRALLRFSRNK